MLTLTFGRSNGFFVGVGKGVGTRALNAFDHALLHAGMGNYNLLQISSILPPFSRREDRIPLPKSSLLPVAYSREIVEEPGIRIVAGIGVGVPSHPEECGVIMEYHGMGTKEDAERILREMVEEAMETRGVPVKECIVSAIEMISESKPSCVFAGVAVFPLG